MCGVHGEKAIYIYIYITNAYIYPQYLCLTPVMALTEYMIEFELQANRSIIDGFRNLVDCTGGVVIRQYSSVQFVAWLSPEAYAVLQKDTNIAAIVRTRPSADSCLDASRAMVGSASVV